MRFSPHSGQNLAEREKKKRHGRALDKVNSLDRSRVIGLATSKSAASWRAATRTPTPAEASWFEPAEDAQQFMVRDELKQLVHFKTLNLMDDWPMKGPIDVIFCRNVVIYFDRETQRQIVARMAALQRPNDYLILGHSESLLQVSTQYQLVRDTVHRRLP